MPQVHKLTPAQAASIEGHILPSGEVVHALLDGNGDYILSQATVNAITDPAFLWAKDCPLIEYVAPPIEL